MTKTITSINILLDASGSMRTIVDPTISEFNEFLISQRSLPGEVFITLATFHSPGSLSVLEKLTPLEKVADLHLDTYNPNGPSTALYDNIADFLDLCEETYAIADLQGGTDAEVDVITVIMTDGQENASQTHTQKEIFDRLSQVQSDKQWNVLFLGANQDAYSEGAKIGTLRGSTRTFAATNAGVSSTWQTTSKSLSNYRVLRAGGQTLSYDPELLANAPDIITGEEEDDTQS